MASARQEIAVRPCRAADLEAVQAIYAHHVRHGTGSFEETPPDLAEMTRRWERIAGAGLPWLVAELGDRVAGYAYAGPFHPRPAYRFTLEDSVYVAPDAARCGAGRALLSDLLRRCEAAGFRQMVAVIGDSANAGSVGLHRAFGFTYAGALSAVGFKFGRWLDTVTMQRPLGPGSTILPPEPQP
ncbi:GNAT family N-acetyltransferase [Rhodobacteraceae bacterium DSL-40]|uniref:GNAT family N-acetyltransferase n=1 Tax=Amaricoccus sp. B4 TaxID=3368557 RepID=UPI000DAEC77C